MAGNVNAIGRDLRAGQILCSTSSAARMSPLLAASTIFLRMSLPASSAICRAPRSPCCGSAGRPGPPGWPGWNCVASLPFFCLFLAGVLSVIEPSVIWLTQLSASPHVLELPQARALFLPQKGSQRLGEPRRHRLTPVQMPGNLPLDVGDMLAVLGFAHDRPALRGLIWSPILIRHSPLSPHPFEGNW